MSVSTVNNTYAASNSTSVTNTTYTDNNTLSMDDFFQLLAAELQNQDALDP
jgi:flagellar hook assembly protein FlgD